LEVTPQKGVDDLCGRKIAGKVAQITFRASLGTCGQKSFGEKIAPPKCACSYTFDEKAPPPPLPPFLKGQRGKCPRHA